MDTDTLNEAASQTDWELPPGYVTGEFTRAERALEGDLSHDRLLDLLLFADDREEKQRSHREPIARDWEGLRNKIGAQLLRRMGSGQGAESETAWRRGDVDWALRKFRLALEAL